MNILQYKQLTILTNVPVSQPSIMRRRLYRNFKHFVGFFREKQPTNFNQIRGPGIVQINLLKGLDCIGQFYRFNPPYNLSTPYVGVLSNVEALRWAIRAKQDGIIKRLIAGPNLLITPLLADGILCAPEIDIVVTPCKWVHEWYVSLAPQLKNKIVEWPVGIDTDYWCPDLRSKNSKPNLWLIYNKTDYRGKSELKAVQSELERRGENYEVINYGQYGQEHYLNILRHSKALIMLSPSESQGIAQFEAWACDIPILAWDSHRFEWEGRVFNAPSVSSSPYLSAECGMRFSNQYDLQKVLDKFINNLANFTPRKYVVQNFSLSKAALSYIRIFNK